MIQSDKVELDLLQARNRILEDMILAHSILLDKYTQVGTINNLFAAGLLMSI